MTLSRRGLLTTVGLALATPMLATGRARAEATLRIARVSDGLDEPWALAFLPDGRFLVTERAGRLTLFAPDGSGGRSVGGLPEVAEVGQGGLLDVMLPRDFAVSRRVWLTYAEPGDGGASTALGFGTLSADGRRIEGFRRVHNGPAVAGGRHFGSRAVEARDGSVFLTTGDRGNGALAQDVGRPEGKVLVFHPDGTPIPMRAFEDRPGAMKGLWTMGHRNIQGAALDAGGALWTVEHGARGGDELNSSFPGQNYGWPVITYGVNYDGRKIGEGTARQGMVQPVHYWDPSIAPSGLVFHSGRMFTGWKGHVLTGSLNSDLIARLDPAVGYAETRIETAETTRVRDVREGPDGAVWFLSVGEGAVFRMVPG